MVTYSIMYAVIFIQPSFLPFVFSLFFFVCFFLSSIYPSIQLFYSSFLLFLFLTFNQFIHPFISLFSLIYNPSFFSPIHLYYFPTIPPSIIYPFLIFSFNQSILHASFILSFHHPCFLFPTVFNSFIIIHLSILHSIHPSIFPSLPLPIHPSIHPPLFPFPFYSIHPSNH